MNVKVTVTEHVPGHLCAVLTVPLADRLILYIDEYSELAISKSLFLVMSETFNSRKIY